MNNTMTGYPSIDKPWLKYYEPGAYERATIIPQNKTVWDVIEECLIRDKEVPAIEYFGRKISREEFIAMVYAWAKTFKSLGVKEDEVVPIYGPFVPDVCAMALALNAIGATSYFLKLAISPEALAEETKESRIAVVFDDMGENVCFEFEKDRFERVIIYSVTDYMPAVTKAVVSLLKATKKNDIRIPRSQKYISLKQAKKLGEKYSGELKASFVPDRSAFITSSSGTTVGGVVKGTVATNESTLMQLAMAGESYIKYEKGDSCLNNLPPTASTSLNVLFLYALYKGLKIFLDPRVSEKDFYNQIIKNKPNVVLTTGSMWDSFFSRLQDDKAKGKAFDFAFAKGWFIGGEGTELYKYNKWNRIMSEANATNELFSGYGCSELFSAISMEKPNARTKGNDALLSVGIPYVGITLSVFDESGKELTYNQRGELWIKSGSAMKCYYNKPELTSKVLVDGWIHTGDIAEINKDGFIFIYGRCSDYVVTPSGEKIYLFDVANTIKKNPVISDAVVLNITEQNDMTKLYAHLEWANGVVEAEKITALNEIDKAIKLHLPREMEIAGYAEHDRIPYSPTTLKKDKNRLAKQRDGYFRVENNKRVEVC